MASLICPQCLDVIHARRAVYVPCHTVYKRSWRTFWRPRPYMCPGSYRLIPAPRQPHP